MELLNDPAAMRGLLLTYTEKVLALEEEKRQLTPKTEMLRQGEFETIRRLNPLRMPE